MKSNAYPQLYRLCEQRYSCRAYSDRKVERDTVLTVLDIVRLAPSACNRQPWKFLVADSDEQRAAILSSYDREWIRTAPEFIVACGIHDEAWLCLAATSLGLGTCWVCNFDPKAIAEAFGLPEGVEPVAIIPLGYPAEGVEVPAKKRKELDEIVKWGRF